MAFTRHDAVEWPKQPLFFNLRPKQLQSSYLCQARPKLNGLVISVLGPKLELSGR